MKKKKFITTHPAIIAVWAALIAVASLLPAFPLIGGTGGTFSLGNALTPLSGILFGPFAGAIASAIGAFLGQLLAPNTVILGPLQFILPGLAALFAGFAMQKKWYLAFAMYVVNLVGFLLLPVGKEAYLFPLVVYAPPLIAILFGWFVAKDWISSPNRAKMLVAVFCCALAGTHVDNGVGNIWATIMFGLPKEVFFSIMAIAPIERILFALGSAIIGTPLLVGLPKISIPVGPALEEEEE